MTELEREAVRLAIIDALGKKWFNATGVADACRVLNRPTYGDRNWTLMNVMHCKDWSAMSQQAAVELVHVVGEALGLEVARDPSIDAVMSLPMHYAMRHDLIGAPINELEA